MDQLVASQRVTAKRFSDCDQKLLRLLITSRLGLMKVRRKTLTVSAGRYRLNNVKPPLTDEQIKWLNSEPATQDKIVFVWNVCAAYLKYCENLAEGETPQNGR